MKKWMLVGVSFLLVGVMTACSQSVVEKPVTDTKISQSSDSKQTTNSDNKQTQTKVNIISVEEAIKIYTDKQKNTDITSVELENNRGKFVYHIKGVDDNKEYKLSIDAETKDILKDRSEKLDRDEQNGQKRKNDKLAIKELLSVDKATEIAEKEVGSGTATDWELDRELNQTYWEVQVKDGHKETTVKLDAKTGEILATEQDD